jgi:hypothetical protein
LNRDNAPSKAFVSSCYSLTNTEAFSSSSIALAVAVSDGPWWCIPIIILFGGLSALQTYVYCLRRQAKRRSRREVRRGFREGAGLRFDRRRAQQSEGTGCRRSHGHQVIVASNLIARSLPIICPPLATTSIPHIKPLLETYNSHPSPSSTATSQSQHPNPSYHSSAPLPHTSL